MVPKVLCLDQFHCSMCIFNIFIDIPLLLHFKGEFLKTLRACSVTYADSHIITVSDLQQIGGLLCVLQVPPIELTTTI